MKRIVIAVVFAVGSSSVALVGTFALYNWSGLYFGAHVAWERGVVEGTTCAPGFITGLSGSCSPDGSPLLYRQTIDGWLGGG